mmetsp:Transcript_15944/g.17841  ORF Transcript_15944/g.17841 Transcript_15944/m.17841 type:complete len:501 (-) Transcript_15944:3010-4512(-)|eukprot:CAMPEP_0171021272 /NCGR_PEP_ID=MMETSP0736-20130129/30523_1 /TAXON_ID=186038 /ORGANISM="Fragilariopsis kerguelensis, Strain L26-C5" /LENGTH=500 /DNA_ID=CAMNT_0011459455 /DNA_START=137 /DNA_END=1639 /DNA_ORIENTATION=-
MVDLAFRHESSHLSSGNIMIKSPAPATSQQEMPSPVRRNNNRSVSPLTQNESMFGTISRGTIPVRTHSLDNSDDERQQPSLASIPSRNNGEIICDYDRSVTDLYEMLESSEWEKACARCRTHPEEVHTWVSRRDTNDNIRWQLLPLHAAVIFQAPLPVIEDLLKEHPIAAAKRDDQGMLPLHLAFRHKSDESVIEKLLRQYPGGVIIQDQRERIPLNHGKEMSFSSKMMSLYAETYIKYQHNKNETIANEAEIKATYENRMLVLKDAYEARIFELINAHEDIVESKKIEAKQDAQKHKTQHKQEIDQLRSILSREVLSGRRASQLETDLQGLNNSLVEEKREKEVLQKIVQDQKTQKDNLTVGIHQILIEQKALHDHCERQEEKLVQAQKLREQLLRTLLQKDDGKAVQVSNEICQLSSNNLGRTEKLLNDVTCNDTTLNVLPTNTENNTVVQRNDCLENPTPQNPTTADTWSADHNDDHNDDVSAITESSYLQPPFGDR